MIIKIKNFNKENLLERKKTNRRTIRYKYRRYAIKWRKY